MRSKYLAADWRLYQDIPEGFKKYSEHVRPLQFQSDEKPNFVYLRLLAPQPLPLRKEIKGLTTAPVHRPQSAFSDPSKHAA